MNLSNTSMLRGCLWATMILLFALLGSGCADGEATIVGGDNNSDGNDDDPGDNGDNDNGDAEECPHRSGGECADNTLMYCSNGKERIIECDEAFEDGICRRTGATAWCHVPLNHECVTNSDPDNEEARARYVRCNAPDGACVMNGYGEPAICRPNVDSCTASQVGQCIQHRYYVEGCLGGQPRAYDCEALGGTCAGSACRGMEEGTACQVKGFHSRRFMLCGDGLTCVGETDISRWGVCVPED